MSEEAMKHTDVLANDTKNQSIITVKTLTDEKIIGNLEGTQHMYKTHNNSNCYNISQEETSSSSAKRQIQKNLSRDEKEQNDKLEPPHGPYVPVGILGKGTYGTVYKAFDENNAPVALKVIKFTEESEGIPSTVLREISLLKELSHANIITLLSIRPTKDCLVLVFELSACDLRHYQDLCMQPLSARRVKSFMHQLLQGIAYIHSLKILHRDLKPQNLLLEKDGTLKIADFGLARVFSVPVREFAHEVVTLWYRAPDILLGNQSYTTGVDMWSVGCIFAEMLRYHPLFTGNSIEEHLSKIFGVLGTPSLSDFPNHTKFVKANLIEKLPHFTKKDLAECVPNADEDAIDLLKQFLVYDGEKRLSAAAALQHPYFTRTQFEEKIPLRLEQLKERRNIYLKKLSEKKIEKT